MTAIVPDWIRTKKQLRETLAEGRPVLLSDPTPWGSRTICLNATRTDGKEGPLHTIEGREVQDQSIFCTNHPKRSWFAEIRIGKDGKLKVL